MATKVYCENCIHDEECKQNTKEFTTFVKGAVDCEAYEGKNCNNCTNCIFCSIHYDDDDEAVRYCNKHNEDIEEPKICEDFKIIEYKPYIEKEQNDLCEYLNECLKCAEFSDKKNSLFLRIERLP